MRPLIPLCQINLTKAPHRPAALDDLALIAIYISGNEIPYNTPNGQGWMLRAYTHEQFTRLVPIEAPTVRSPIKPVTMGWEPIAFDYPAYDELRVLDVDIPEELVDCYADEYPNHHVSKVGGWPSLIQSVIIWPDSDQYATPEFVLQIDSEEGNGWFWGDAGTGYFGRGTGEYRSVWSLDWQCY